MECLALVHELVTTIVATIPDRCFLKSSWASQRGRNRPTTERREQKKARSKVQEMKTVAEKKQHVAKLYGSLDLV